MFTEFLHPELVLFGDFLNPKIGCKHHVEFKDNQITVHQIFERAPKAQSQYRAIQEAQRFLKKQALEEYEDERLDHEQADYLRQEAEDYEGDNEQYEEDDYERDNHGNYQEDENPYDEGYYGYNIAGKYGPNQLAALLNNNLITNSPAKISQIPFTKETPLKQKKQQQQQHEDDDEQWVTEEEEEEYVTNQMLEEAGGNFAADL